MILRDYQKAAIAWLRRRKRGAVIARAGSGKTIIMAGALCEVVTSVHRTRKVNIGWIVPTIDIAAQAEKAIAAFPAMASHIDVKISCAAADTDWSDRDVLIVDECHKAPAPQWAKQIKTCGGAIWGCTATPESEDEERNAAMESIFLEQYEVPKEATAGYLAEGRVIMLDATDEDLESTIDQAINAMMVIRRRSWRGEEGELWAQVAHLCCMQLGVVPNVKRNLAIVDTARKHVSDSVLVLVGSIEHGEALTLQIPGAVMAFSKMGKKRRAAAIDGFRSGEIKCMVGTTLFQEGFDAPICNVFINAATGRSARAAEQGTGRALRSREGKTHGTIYDFEDTFHPLTQKQSRCRLDVYRRLGYAINSDEFMFD